MYFTVIIPHKKLYGEDIDTSAAATTGDKVLIIYEVSIMGQKIIYLIVQKLWKYPIKESKPFGVFPSLFCPIFNNWHLLVIDLLIEKARVTKCCLIPLKILCNKKIRMSDRLKPTPEIIKKGSGPFKIGSAGQIILYHS